MKTSHFIMERKREKTLREALDKNQEEIIRWTQYQEDHQIAINNLDSFAKKIVIDVMVPIGTKALIPGQLCHTNEVFVSHFTGLFSKCSSYQAKEICENRIKLAKTKIEEFTKERELFKNKLNIPKIDGALPSEGQHEIIEEYNEEREKEWRIVHREKLRCYKKQERENELKEEISNEDIFNTLDELELLEELNNELDQIEIKSDDDTLKKIISGEINLAPEKKRVSHYTEEKDIVVGQIDIPKDNLLREQTDLEKIVEKYKKYNSEAKETEGSIKTNNNTIPNITDFSGKPHLDEDDDSEYSSDGDIPKEVLELETSTKGMNRDDRIKAFKNRLKETEKILKNLKVKTVDDLNEKTNLLEKREYLLDYIEILKDIDSDKNLSEISDTDIRVSPDEEVPQHQMKIKKKNISFAAEDEIQYIDVTKPSKETIRSEIISNRKQGQGRDIIKLDFCVDSKHNQNAGKVETTINTIVNKKVQILDKVEKNREYVVENQSQLDFDIVGKILECPTNSTDEVKTLFIKFNHSDGVFKNFERSENDTESGTVLFGSPAEIYTTLNEISLNAQQEESPIPSYSHFKAYEDERTKYFVPKENDLPSDSSCKIERNSSNNKTKSILKNKNVITNEIRNEFEEKRSKTDAKKKKKKQKEEFQLIMGDIIENPPVVPDPLPKEKFIDAHVPKKRISRFKEARLSQTR